MSEAAASCAPTPTGPTPPGPTPPTGPTPPGPPPSTGPAAPGPAPPGPPPSTGPAAPGPAPPGPPPSTGPTPPGPTPSTGPTPPGPPPSTGPAAPGPAPPTGTPAPGPTPPGPTPVSCAAPSTGPAPPGPTPSTGPAPPGPAPGPTPPGPDPVQSPLNTASQTGAHPPISPMMTKTHKASVMMPKLQSTGPPSAAPAPVPITTTTTTLSGHPPASTTRPPLIQMTSVAQASGRTLVIIPRPANPPPLAVAPRPRPAAPMQLPANFQVPAGMVLVRSDSGQLMLVSQQALAQAQAQQGQAMRPPAASTPGLTSPQASLRAPQVSAATAVKAENTPVIRIAAPPSVQAVTVQKTAVVKPPQPVVRPLVNSNFPSGTAPPPTITQETLDNVKKCKNFLVTLIKLASSGTQSAGMANNVRELVRKLLDGSMEPEGFTEQLYRELKSSPQPYLVPFLKKSLPAVRHLTPNPQLFIQQADQPKAQASTSTAPAPVAPARAPTFLSANIKHSTISRSVGHALKPTQLVLQHPKGVAVRPVATPTVRPKTVIIQSGHHHTGGFAFKRPLVQAPRPSTKCAFKAGSGYYKEDDDINDVAFMAGVNLTEEKACILPTGGSLPHSCQDEPFLPPGPLLARILHSGQAVGVTDIHPEVVSLVSHATQERLRGLLEKVTVMAEHRKLALKEEQRYVQVSDVRAQLRYMEEVERLKRQRKDEEEKEKLFHIARSRSHSTCPDQQLLKQQAKELQQMEIAQLQQKQANLTALAAIGPRKRKPQDGVGNQLSVLSRTGVQKVTRVTLRDLLLCMEQDRTLRHSLLLYSALLK